jgi:CubicO group peptidase (beta-lactamase class C family)/D-alanyl-D-alanine dipeptidase
MRGATRATRWLTLLVLLLLVLPPVLRGAEGDIAPPEGYQKLAQHLEAFIQQEVKAKGIPALSIALVDDQKIIWARGFGLADPEKKKPASADTVYRVGSVSKLFTDLAIMQLVERGELRLDDPVRMVLNDFRPVNPFDKEITLRQLMSHRAGLVREPPEGNYFDPSMPSLQRTVASLNRTRLVYAPESRTKYSNAGIAVVGLVLEQTQKERFPAYLSRTLLQPMGMTSSSFEPEPALARRLAKGVMWTYHGREFPAPTFELGIAPAGSLYTTVKDLSRFLSVLFAGGRTRDGAIVSRKTLETMWTPQFAKKGTKTGFGIGFAIRPFEGRRRIGHGGAVYGFSTELAALPKDKLGVVVISARDVTNSVTRRIADVALRHLLAVRDKKPLPTIVRTRPVPKGMMQELAGRYRSGSKQFDLVASGDKLYLWPDEAGMRVEVRLLKGNTLMTDGRLGYGLRIEREEKGLRIGKEVYERVAIDKPKPAPARWQGLIGEYGWDHDVLYILEKDGQLHALIEWIFLYPLKEIERDVFAFPGYGLYQDEKLIFSRDKTGRATRVEAASVVFERRSVKGEAGTFRIRPIRPLEELRREAKKASPPAEKGPFREPNLVNLARLEPTLKFDIRYATTNNFLSTPFYQSARAYMQKPAAQALVRAHRALRKQGYGLLIFDSYRPWYVTKMFHDATPVRYRNFVADPAKGSRHNRGCAVDLTLYDLKTGKPVEMVSGYDEFTDRAYPDYPGGASLARYHRALLRQAMEAAGFTVYEAEWWHYDYKDWKKYPILNLTFEKLEAGKK